MKKVPSFKLRNSIPRRHIMIQPSGAFGRLGCKEAVKHPMYKLKLESLRFDLHDLGGCQIRKPDLHDSTPITLDSKHTWPCHAAMYSRNWAMRNRDCLWYCHLVYQPLYHDSDRSTSFLIWSLHILLHAHIVLGVGPVASSTDPLDTGFWECGAWYLVAKGVQMISFLDLHILWALIVTGHYTSNEG